jgi:putative ABC transport system permease protein
MAPLDRKLWRTFGRIWAQTLAIALVLGCGIMVLVMAEGTLRSLSETRAAYYDRHRFADVFANATRAPKSLLPVIATLPGVAAIEARVVLTAAVDLPGMVEPASARILSLPDSGAPGLNVPLLRAGRMPDPRTPEEALVSEPFAQENGILPGGVLDVTLNGERRRLRVVGHALSPEFVYTVAPGAIMPDNRHFGLVWMNEAPLAAAGDLGGSFNDVTLGLLRNADAAAVIDALDRLLAPYGGTGAHARDRQTSHAFLESEMSQLSAMARTLPPVFLIVSAFLVNMVLGRLIGMERGQIGLLKALGYGTAAIAAHYLKLALGIGAAGVLLGWAAGWWLGAWMTGIYADFFRFPWLIYTPGVRAMVLAGVLGLATVTVGAAVAVWRSARLPPAVAMQPPAPPVFRRGIADRIGRALVLRQTTMMILRSITRWPGRAAVTFLGVAASVAVLVASFFTFDATDRMMEELFTLANRQHATIFLSRPEAAADAVGAAATLPGVRVAEGAFGLPVRIVSGAQSRLTLLEAHDPGARLTRLADASGRPVEVPRHGIVLPDGLAQSLGLAPGDRVRLELLAPPRETWEVTVAAIVRQSLGQQIYMDGAEVFGRMRTVAQINRVNMLIDMDALPDLYRAVKSTPRIAGLALWADVRAELEGTFRENMIIMTFVFSALGGLITIGVIYNAARIQLAERAHELASLRVLGFTRGEVGYILVGEMMLLTLAAVPLGWLGGRGFAALMAEGFSTDIVTLPFALSRRTYAAAALLAVVAALLAVLLVRRRLDRVDLVAALKQKE